MKKHILLGTALASLFALGACDYNEDNFPGFDEKETITDVSTDTLVLADAHYGKIASMPKNQRDSSRQGSRGADLSYGIEPAG